MRLASDIIIVLENKLSDFAKENGMKHLKKILLAVLILALLAATVAVTVLADDGDEEVAYTGTVDEARKMLDEVSKQATNEQKSAKLKEVYAYVITGNTPVDPYAEGFEDLMLDYSNATLAVAEALLADYNAALDRITREAKLVSAYSHYASAPVYSEYESLNEDGYLAWQAFRTNYTAAAVEVLSAYLEPVRNAVTLDERHTALKTLANKFSTKAIYFAVPNDDDATYEIPGLEDFVHEFNRWCLAVASDYIDAANTPAEMTAARSKYIGTNNAYNRDTRYFNHAYLPLVEKMDLKIIMFANQLLDEVEITSDNYKTSGADALNAVYTYLEKTPCLGLTRTQLADTVGASHTALQERVNGFAYAIAQCYYAEVEKFVGGDGAVYSDAVNNFIEFIASCPTIIYRPGANTGEYNGDIATAEDLLLAVKDAENLYLESYAALCAYLYESAPAPDAEGAEEFYSAFEDLKREVSDFIVICLKDLNSAPTVAGGNEIDEEAFRTELEKLGNIADFINNNSVSSNAIIEYNETAQAFLVTVENLWCSRIEYTAPEYGTAVGDIDEATALLEAVDLKADDALEAYAALYEYLTKTPVDANAEGAEELYEAFALLTSDVCEMLLKDINAVATRPAYIDIFASDCPEIVYKAPVTETLQGKVDEAILLVNATNELIDSDAELSEIFAAYAKVYSYNYKTAVSSSLDGSGLYYNLYNALTDEVSEILADALASIEAKPTTEDEDGNTVLDVEALKENAKALGVIAAFLEECTINADAVDTYNALRAEIFANIKDSYGDEYNTERFDSDLAKLGEIAAFLAKAPVASEIFDAYNAKISEFKYGIGILKCPTTEGKVFETKALDGDLAEIEALVSDVELSAKARLDAYSELYNYLKDNAISPEEEGYVAFYTEYIELTATISADVLEKLASINSNPLYFEVSYPAIIYFATEPLTYTGSLADATELLNKARYAVGDVNPDTDEVLDTFSLLFSYMRVSAVPKNVEGADKFYLDYEQAKTVLTEFIVGEIKAVSDYLDAQDPDVALVESVLLDNADLLSFVRDNRVSEEAVAAYNALIAKLKSYVADDLAPDPVGISLSVDAIIEIADFLKDCPISIDIVNVYNASLHGYTKTLKLALDAKYGEFVSAKAELDAYLEASAGKHAALGITEYPEDIDNEEFLEKVAELDGYVKIKDITDYIYSPSKPSVDEYREDFVKVLNDIISADLLVYESKPESNIYSGTVNEAQAIIDRYNAASNMAEKAEIYAELFEYVSNNVMNPKLHGYEDVMNSVSEMGDEVCKYLIAKIDAAESNEEKTLAIAEMRAYLEKTPISEAAFSAYNTKFLYTYNQQLNESYATYSAVMLALHEFIEGYEGADELIASFEGFASAIDNYETLETLALVKFYEMKTLDEDPTAGTVSVTARGGAVKILNNYVRKYPIGEDSYAYDETMADVNAISDAYKQLVEDARAALDDKTPLEDYDNDAYYYIVDNDNGTGLGFTHADPSVGTMVEYFPDTARGGMYARYSYGSATKNAFLGKSGIPGTIGLVIEFDLTGDNGVTQFTFNRLDRTTGSAIQQNMFSIKNNCFIYDGPGAEKWKNKEVITPGEWTKFIFVYDPVNITLTGYIDYELVGTWSVRYAANPNDPLVEVRFNGAVVNTSFNIDNFMIYSGSNYRILDKYESMTITDEFEYFVNYMNDETRAPTSRLQAYQKATGLLEEIKADATLAEQIKDVIEKYDATDIEKDIIGPAKLVNLEKIKEYGARLNAYEGNVTTQNYEMVQLLVDELEEFIANNSEYIDKSNDSYKDVSASISRFKSLLDRCNNVTSFVNALENFRSAYTLAAKNKYYASVVQYYELAQLYRPEIQDEVKLDPAVIEFEAKLNEGLTSADEGYVDIFAYYDKCGEELGIQQNRENSKRIIDCVNFITSLEGYEDTETFWQANFDYINKYTTIIRDVIRTNAYDSSFEGVDAAIAKFRVIDVYFYAALQRDHIAFISEQLDKYAASPSYIEKLGICTYVSNYIEANDIDLTNEALASLVLKNETYLSELEIYRKDYETVLEQNTVKFINIVEEMKTQVGYKALSALKDEALLYYYEMNITEESEAAIAVFESYSEAIRVMEENSALFIGYVNAVTKARNDAALFKALAECMPYRELASVEVDGVLNAIEIYEQELEDYNTEAGIINGDIAEINGVVTVIRTNNIASAIMSVVNNILGR